MAHCQDRQSHVAPTEVLENFLFLGDSFHGSHPSILHRLHITRVINMTPAFYDLNRCSQQNAEITVCHLKAEDHPKYPIRQHFDEANAFLAEAEKNADRVLIHCGEGVSRAPTIVLAYLMKSRGWSLKEALLYVAGKRNQIGPNNGFMRQLLDYEQELHDTKSLDVSYFEDNWRPFIRTANSFGCVKVYAEEAMKKKSH